MDIINTQKIEQNGSFSPPLGGVFVEVLARA
jgi:hypothetical protein